MLISMANQRILTRLWVRFLPLQLIVVMAAVGFMVGVTGTMSILLLRGSFNTAHTVQIVSSASQPPIHVAPSAVTTISPIFTSQVQHWASKILAWSQQYDVDPNVIATVMQIESCGDPQAGSGAGAQGLFQVMPFHFAPTDDMHDPDTNARVGIGYLKESLAQADGHVGLALAGYNGGHGLIDVGWANWPSETRRYYLWGTGIYVDALKGSSSSASLQDWLNSGGSILCQQASERLAATPTVIATPAG